MIHGTWGWKGKWWRPGDDFHSFIRGSHRSNLYSRGAKFSWSGAYSDSQRQLAAADFCEWAYEVPPNGLQSVFAHSYGGEVAARARLTGARAAELILLSSPVTKYVEAAAASPDLRIVDVRLRFDPVLGLARTRQRLTPRPNVTPVVLDRWRLDHAATHEEAVWRSEDIARRGQI
jgi:pimeloyl-ACP methyl ester carboxylesterase